MFRFYNDALNAACGTPGEWRASVLEVGIRTTFTIDLVDPHLPQGLFVMLVSASVCALFFTILVWCNSHTWIYFKHKGKYVKVEDQVRKTSIYEIGVSDNVLGPVYATLNNRPWRTRWFHGRACLSKVLLLAINLLLIILRIIIM